MTRSKRRAGIVQLFQFPPERTNRRAFTLLEMLMTVAVLVVVVVLAAQIVNSASFTTRRGVVKMNTENRVRTLFDRMALDFKGMLKRSDIDSVFHKQEGNDRMMFYSQASGFYPEGVTGLTPKSPVSLIGYRVENNRLERLGKALIWNGVTTSTPAVSELAGDASAMVYLPVTLSGHWTCIGPEGAGDPDYQVLGRQVFRLEFCFLGKDGLFSGAYDSQQTVAVVVTIALNEDQNVSPVSNPTLPDGDSPGIADSWISALNATAFPERGGGLKVRVYQRFFPLGVMP